MSPFFFATPPMPTSLLRTLNARVPLAVKRQIVEPVLNRSFVEPLAEGEFDTLEGRLITLHVGDLGIELTLGLENQRLVVSDAPGEAVIRGGWREFLCLATRREDPDSLFFQRRLTIEGDTELGLMVKNLLDAQEQGLAQGHLGTLLQRIDALVNSH